MVKYTRLVLHKVVFGSNAYTSIKPKFCWHNLLCLPLASASVLGISCFCWFAFTARGCRASDKWTGTIFHILPWIWNWGSNRWKCWSTSLQPAERGWHWWLFETITEMDFDQRPDTPWHAYVWWWIVYYDSVLIQWENENTMFYLMVASSWMLRSNLGKWQTRKTRMKPMKITAMLSSFLYLKWRHKLASSLKSA